MGKRKKIIILCFILVSFNTLAQRDSTNQREDYIKPGLIKSSLSFSPSWMLNKPEINYYLTGFLEGYIKKYLSFRVETHYFLDGKNSAPFYKLNSISSIGILAHLNKNNFDGHIGFMPGFSISTVRGDLKENGKHQVHFTPTISVNLGGSYYIWKYLHVFVNATYIHASITEIDTDIGVNGRADEFMICAGLGFNVNVIRKNK